MRGTHPSPAPGAAGFPLGADARGQRGCEIGSPRSPGTAPLSAPAWQPPGCEDLPGPCSHTGKGDAGHTQTPVAGCDADRHLRPPPNLLCGQGRSPAREPSTSRVHHCACAPRLPGLSVASARQPLAELTSQACSMSPATLRGQLCDPHLRGQAAVTGQLADKHTSFPY